MILRHGSRKSSLNRLPNPLWLLPSYHDLDKTCLVTPQIFFLSWNFAFLTTYYSIPPSLKQQPAACGCIDMEFNVQNQNQKFIFKSKVTRFVCKLLPLFLIEGLRTLPYVRYVAWELSTFHNVEDLILLCSVSRKKNIPWPESCLKIHFGCTSPKSDYKA